MEPKPTRAEVYTLDGDKVCVFENSASIDFSILTGDVYIIRYQDKKANILKQEKVILK